MILELVHVASLVHDDVLDNAQFRRNQITIHNDIGVRFDSWEMLYLVMPWNFQLNLRTIPFVR